MTIRLALSRRLVAVTLVAAAAPAAAGQNAAPLLTLSDAVVTALARNQRVIQAADGVLRADLALRLAGSAFTPKLSSKSSSARSGSPISAARTTG